MSDLIAQLPWWEAPTIAFFYGLIIGSFLNVVIYRFHTGKSLSGFSHCLSCGKRLKWFELFPLFSYLGLRGRCRSCGCAIPSRYFLVELLTGVSFFFSAVQASTLPELVYLLLLMSVFVVITVYDIQHYIIPDSLTVLVLVVVSGWFILRFFNGVSPAVLLLDMAASLGGTAFFYGLWYVSKGAWIGFGDVKLSFPLGLIVGAPLVFTMVVYSFWIGAVISVALVGLSKLQRGKLCLRLGFRNLTIKSVVPFAPFLIAGCLLTLFSHLNVLTLFTVLQS